jgi:hypothetical protein
MEAGRTESVQLLSAELRAALASEVRFLFRNMVKAEEFPFLAKLGQSAGSNAERIQIPVNALPGLAREIENIRQKLPAKSTLLKLADSVRNCRGMDLVLAPAGAAAAAAPVPAPAPGNSHAIQGELADNAPLSATTKLQMLKSAAAAVDVSEISTNDLGDAEQAAYYKYCLGLGDYDTIIAALRPRADSDPRVWVWNLLVAAMRLSQHKDFSVVVAEYHIWMEAHHPEALNEPGAAGDKRKFNDEKLAALEARELAGG